VTVCEQNHSYFHAAGITTTLKILGRDIYLVTRTPQVTRFVRCWPESPSAQDLGPRLIMWDYVGGVP